MSMPYSIDLRELAMVRLEAAETTREVTAALRVAVPSVIKWAARKRLPVKPASRPVSMDVDNEDTVECRRVW